MTSARGREGDLGRTRLGELGRMEPGEPSPRSMHWRGESQRPVYCRRVHAQEYRPAGRSQGLSRKAISVRTMGVHGLLRGELRKGGFRLRSRYCEGCENHFSRWKSGREGAALLHRVR